MTTAVLTPPSRGPGARGAGLAQALTIIVTNTMPILAVGTLVPNLPLFLNHFKDVPNAGFLVPLIITMPLLCIAIFSSLAGLIADRIGRRPLLLFSLPLFVVAGVAPFVFDGIYAILGLRFLVGVAEACIPTSGNTLLGDYFDSDRRRRWISLEMMIAPTIGSIMLLAGGLLGTISWKAPFLLYTFGLVPWIAVYLFVWEPARGVADQKPGERTAFPWGKAAVVAATTLLGSIPFFAQNAQHGRIFAALGLKSTAEIAVYAMIAGQGTAIGAYLYRRSNITAVHKALMLGFGGYALSFVFLSTYPPLAIGTAIDLVAQISGGLVYTALLTWAVGSFSGLYRGRGVGVWTSSFYLGSFLSVIIVELLQRRTGDFLQTIGIIGACYGAIALGLVAYEWRRPKAPPAG